ncbi:acyl carrier protein [Streptomyces sp. NRRL F-5630]|uniref:acyl carrier protein n=1 Tax=Streptomyces sp. NRRL F-5630 TaxID=1463864 RepID=UPI003D72F5E6
MGSPAQLHACELLVARLIARAMADRGIASPKAEELVEDAELRAQDLSLFGLSSLDWIALATQLENTIGAEIPDHVLIRPEHRCVADWGEAVLAAQKAQSGAPNRTH